MKKIYPTSGRAKARTGWSKHLRPKGKRMANKSTRRMQRPSGASMD